MTASRSAPESRPFFDQAAVVDIAQRFALQLDAQDGFAGRSGRRHEDDAVEAGAAEGGIQMPGRVGGTPG